MMASRAGSWDGLDDGRETSGKETHFGSEVPLLDRAKKRATELYDGMELQRRVEQHPVGMLAAAWGIGFVLGGGLSTVLAKRVLGLGMRAGMKLLVPMVAEKAWSLTRNAAAKSSR